MKQTEFSGNRNVIFRQLKIARKKARMTQGQLAAKMQLRKINIDQQMISKIENNTRFVTDYELACFCEILALMKKKC